MRKSFRGDKLGALVAIVYVQALLLVIFAGYEALQPATVSAQFTWFAVVFLVILALVLGALGKNLAVGRRWARGPLVTIEIFIALTGIWLFQDDLWLSGGLCLITAVPVIVLLMHKDVVALTTRPANTPE